MGTIDGGTIQSGIRVDLATLKQDVAKVEKIYDQLDAKVQKDSTEISKNIKIVENAQKKGALSQEEAIKRIILIREKSLKALKDEVTTTGKLTTKQIEEIQKQEKELKDLKKAQDNYTTSLDKTNDEMKQSNSSLKDMAVEAGLVTAAIVAAKKAITIFGETEQSLANVRAVTGSTTEEFEGLEKAAIDAGESTRFTANQAADALFYLSSAGLSAKQSTEALDTTLELAGATGSDLAFTAQTITATMSQYGIAADEAGRISNIFAAANANSQATLEKLSGALTAVGPIAGQFGISLEETTASLQALFNAGLKGEQSGTALRNILLTLTDSSSSVSKAFLEAGGSLDELDPRMVGLTGSIEALNESGIDLTDVFDTRAVAAILSLSKASNDGEKGLRALEAAVTDTDEAARQYSVQNDTLFGDIDKLKSASEGLGITLTDQVAPILRGLITIATTIIKTISSLPNALKTLGVGAGAAAVGFTALTTALKFLGIALGGSLGVVSLVGAVTVGLGAYLLKAREVKQIEVAKEFEDLAKALNKSDEALEDFTKKAAEAEVAFRALAASGAGAERLNKFVEETAENLGLSKKEIVAIGLNSKKVSVEYKKQLELINSQIIEQERQEKIQSDIIEGKKLRYKLEQAQLKAEQDRKDLAEKNEQDRIDHINELSSKRETLNALYEEGAISEKELLQQKISLRQEEYDALLEQAKQSGDTSKETVEAIQKQKYWIDQYQTSLDGIVDSEKEAEKTRSDAAKNASLTYGEQLAMAKEYQKLGLITEQELLEEKIRISNEIIKNLKDQAVAEGGLSESIKQNITQQLGFIASYTAAVKEVKNELKGIEDPSLIEELKVQITANLDVLVGDAIKNLGDSLSSAVSASADAAELYGEAIETTKSKIQEISDLEDEINANKQANIKEQISDIEESEISRLSRINELESQITANKQTSIKEQITEIEDAETDRLKRIEAIQESLGAKKLELIQIEEDAAVKALNDKLAGDLKNISDKEAAELAAAGYYVKSTLENLEDQLAAEENVEKKAELKKEIEFQKIRDKFEAQRVKITEKAEKDIEKAQDAANAKRLKAEKDYGAIIDVNAQKQIDFTGLETELTNLKKVNREEELTALQDQVIAETSLEDELAELKKVNREEELTALRSLVQEETTLEEQLGELKKTDYAEQLTLLETQKLAAEESGAAMQALTEQIESIGGAIIKFAEGDYLGGITDILTGLFQPALEDIGTFLANNMTPELKDLGQKFEELTEEFGEKLAPLLLDLLILLEPFLALAVEVLDLALEFTPLISIFIKLNPQLKLLIFYAQLLTTGMEELNKFAKYVTDNTKPLQEFFNTIIDFLESLGTLGSLTDAADEAAGAGSTVVTTVKKFFGFETGGIVPQEAGVPSTGDNQLVRTNPGEMILNGHQQQNLFDMISKGVGNGGRQNPQIIIQLDGQELADSTAAYINNGLVEVE